MKIGIFTWKSFGIEDMTEAFQKLGHEVLQFILAEENPLEAMGRRQAVEGLRQWIRKAVPDILFSFNYFPVLAEAAKREGLPYISWIYDSPHVRMYDYTVAYPTNYVFVFDSAVYQEFNIGGVQNVYFLPLAANPERLRKLQGKGLRHKVSFVGSLYTEQHCFFERLQGITKYTQGYLEALLKAQHLIYGVNFIQSSLPEAVLEDMQRVLPMWPQGVEDREYLFAQYVLNRELTVRERREYLGAVAERYGLDLYTPDKTVSFPDCRNHGMVNAYSQAPYVYKESAINLNITLRSIINGIPLRAFEIMGAGGFLLTNYQEDFNRFFMPGEDYVYFDSRQDMMAKIEYYLTNEKERRQIAENGFRKIQEQHTYLHRAREMLSYVRE